MLKPKKILIINQEEVLFLDPLNRFLENHATEISKIYFTPFFPPQANKWNYIKTSFKITGKKYMANYLLRDIFNKCKSTIFFPNSIRRKSSIRQIAKYHKVPCELLRDVNDPIFIDFLRKEKIENILSLTSQIYKKEIINIPGLKIYNFHPSLLPNNKGRWPIFWAVVKGDQQGITCHEINEKIDDGAIIYQQAIQVKSNSPVEAIMEVVLKEMPNIMSKVLGKINKNELTPIIPKYSSFYGSAPDQETIRKYWKLIKN